MKAAEFLGKKTQKASDFLNKVDLVTDASQVDPIDDKPLEIPFIDPIDAIAGPLGFTRKMGIKMLPKWLAGSLASEPVVGGVQEFVSEKTGGLPTAARVPINLATGVLTGGLLSSGVKQASKFAKPLSQKSKFLKDIVFEKYAGIKTPASQNIKSGKNLTTRLKDSIKTPQMDAFFNKQLQRIPKALELIPGGKAINKALIYGYRGDLPDTKGFNNLLETSKINRSLGIDYGVDLGKRLQSFNEADQIKLGQYIRGETKNIPKNIADIGEETKGILYNLGKQAVDVGILSEETFFKNAGKYMPRLYTSKEYQSLASQFGGLKKNKMDLSRFQKRKDIPKEIRKEMGEILTPGFPVAKGVAQLTHDIEMGKFFKGVAQNPKWTKAQTIKRVLNKDGSITQSLVDPENVPKGWVKLGNNKKLGHLKDSYVHPEIADEINYVMRQRSAGKKAWDSALGKWKFGKVILSPKTHGRNIMSNTILAHLGGFPMWSQPKYLLRGLKELKKGGAFWEAAKKTGLLDSTFVQKDLRGMFDNIESQLPGVKSGGFVNDTVGISQIVNALRSAGNKMASTYQAEEQVFKLAKMMYNVEKRGMDVRKASQEAEKWLFNYGKLTKFQDQYKSHYLGAPFATFTFKSAPRIMEAAMKTPWRFAAPIAMTMGIEQAAQNLIGDTDEQIKAKKELRPEWMKKGIATFPRVPLIDDYGREHYMNLNYIMPWGDLTEGGAPSGIMPFTQPFLKEPIEQLANRDFFFDTPIVKDRDIEGLTKKDKTIESSKKRIEHFGRTMLPTPVGDIQKLYSSYKNEPDYRGRFRNPKVVAADALLGIKMYPVDYAEQMALQLFKKNPQAGIIGRKIQRDIRQAYIKKKALADKGITSTQYDKIIEHKILQLKGLAKEVGILGQTFKKVKGVK